MVAILNIWRLIMIYKNTLTFYSTSETIAESLCTFINKMSDCSSAENSVDTFTPIKQDKNPSTCNKKRGRSVAKYVDVDGVRKSFSDCCNENGIDYGTAYYRYYIAGWDLEKSLSHPVREVG